MEWLEGKRTYIIAFIAAGVGLAQAFGVEVPEWLAYVLGAAGITTLRAAVSNEK